MQTKTSGELQVLKKVNLEVKPGEFVAIVGKSGSGRSTLLRLIAGLEDLTNGRLFFNEQQTKGLHEDTRIMFQDWRLLPWKSVIDNIQIGVSGRDEQAAKTSLNLVGLADKQNEWPSVLSGGQAACILSKSSSWKT